MFGYDNPFSSFIGEIKSSGIHKGSREDYVAESGMFEIPADLEVDVMNRIRETAVNAYKALGCKGMARIDFFLDNDGTLYLNKVNTAPGFKTECIYPRLMKELGMELPYLLDKLLEQAIENAERTY